MLPSFGILFPDGFTFPGVRSVGWVYVGGRWHERNYSADCLLQTSYFIPMTSLLPWILTPSPWKPIFIEPNRNAARPFEELYFSLMRIWRVCRAYMTFSSSFLEIFNQMVPWKIGCSFSTWSDRTGLGVCRYVALMNWYLLLLTPVCHPSSSRGSAVCVGFVWQGWRWPLRDQCGVMLQEHWEGKQAHKYLCRCL